VAYQITYPKNFENWKETAHELLKRNLAPKLLLWEEEQPLLPFADPVASEWERLPVVDRGAFIPSVFLSLAYTASFHRNPVKWEILYRVLYRLLHEKRSLLKDEKDQDVIRLQELVRSVSHEVDKMKAFVRFKKGEKAEGDETFVAWYEPRHPVVPIVAPFFKNRFSSMNWKLVTPEHSVEWNGAQLKFGPGGEAPPTDTQRKEELWKAYYQSTFAPTQTMVPKGVISRRTGNEGTRTTAHYSALPKNLGEIKTGLSKCRGCLLYSCNVQAVSGEGDPAANLVFVGDHPSDEEDTYGRLWLGAGGKLLLNYLAKVNLSKSDIYFTNAVKHFSHQGEGEWRLSRPPQEQEVIACRPWLFAELNILKPRVLVCLGPTAAYSILGREISLSTVRRRALRTSFCATTVVMRHPSSLIEISDAALRASAEEELLSDLRWVKNLSLMKSEKHGTQAQYFGKPMVS
jgi:uracil-DNA glycosylase